MFWSGCSCYNATNVTRLADWGDKVNPLELAKSSFFFKEDLSSCEQDGCSMTSSTTAPCFTNQKYDLREYFISGNNVVGIEALHVDCRMECWDHCKEHEVVILKIRRWAGFFSGGECLCFDNVDDCLLPWVDDVNTDQVAEGEIYF